MRGGLGAAMTAILLGGCAISVAEAPPEGRLEIFTPKGVFNVDALEPSWIVVGDSGAAREHVSVVNLQGVPALRVDGSRTPFALVRRTKALLPVSPFLSWSWYMQASAPHPHPLRLIVGFHGGRADSRSWGGQPLTWTGSSLPPHDRVLALTWGASSLQRGSFLKEKTDATGAPVSTLPRFVVRGGPEHAEAWRLDTVDLSQLYAKAWPKDDPSRVSIVFLGFSYRPTPGAPTPRGYLSGLLLTR